MKTLVSTLVLAIALLSACKKSDDTLTPATAPTFPEVIAPGTWIISAYTERTEDKLKTLGTIKINFTSDGKAIATLDNQTTSGSWSWGGNSYYGTPADSKTVTLNFGTTKPYDRVSQTWLIVDSKSNIIRLDHSNPAEDKHITLSK
ncbi:MAG: hypothetical protein EOO39_19150 [Cytophagaceae bacterium]|nr:MAG: hypothetical protein EOO39_19150 [Cytophagaceae bacterium]